MIELKYKTIVKEEAQSYISIPKDGNKEITISFYSTSVWIQVTDDIGFSINKEFAKTILDIINNESINVDGSSKKKDTYTATFTNTSD